MPRPDRLRRAQGIDSQVHASAGLENRSEYLLSEGFTESIRTEPSATAGPSHSCKVASAHSWIYPLHADRSIWSSSGDLC